MPVTTTGSNPKLLWPGIHATFGVSYDENTMEWQELFDQEDSKKNYEEDVEMTGFGLVPIKPEGDATTYDSAQQGYTKRYVHVAYSMGFIVTREEMDDNLYGEKATRRAEMLGFSLRQTEEIVCANVYNRAFTSGYAGGDGKQLLATDHPSLAGAWSNALSPAADLSEAALEDLFIQIDGAKNSRGLQIALKGQKLILPRQLRFEAARILKSVGQPGTANNDINAIKALNMLPGGMVVNHYLTDPDAWFVRSNAPRGMTYFLRTETEFTQDNDFDTQNKKAKVYKRFAVGWTDPRALYGSAGA